MYETYPKGKGSLPKETKPREEETDSVYRARADLGKSEDTRFRNLIMNDYGKKPQVQDKFDGGNKVNPRRTIISTQGGLTHGHR
jgi:hypothetical protein